MNPFNKKRFSNETATLHLPRIPYVSISKTPKILKEDTFCFEDIGNNVFRKVSTVSLLLHAEKYAQIYGESSMARLAQMMSRPSAPSNSSLTDGMSDKDILRSVKPKHVQGINDMSAYSAYINRRAESLSKEFNSALRNEIDAQVTAQRAAQSSESSKSD